MDLWECAEGEDARCATITWSPRVCKLILKIVVFRADIVARGVVLMWDGNVTNILPTSTTLDDAVAGAGTRIETMQ